MIPAKFTQYSRNLKWPQPGSHKGQNGKVMVIGGSQLFHAASQWALTVVSRMVDMVFYSSVPSNNLLVHEAKANFHNGIVIPRQEIENYIGEADVVLIGPGMERGHSSQLSGMRYQKPTKEEWDNNTEVVTNYLLSEYPDKKWVIDAGALQMVGPKLLNKSHIITPHQGELERLMKKVDKDFDIENWKKNLVADLSPITYHLSPTTLLKGPIDFVFNNQQLEKIPGGNSGMTKGGTGDVLAGLVAGLYCFTNDPFSAAVIGSYVNKKAGDELFEKVGPFFNASDLADQIPKTLANIFGNEKG